MTDPHRIDSVATLREMLGEPSPIARGKVWTTLAFEKDARENL